MNGRIISPVAALWAAGCLLAGPHAMAAEAAPPGPGITLESFQAKVYESPNGGKLLYRQLSPAKVESGRKYPLVLFLHGAGGRGGDNARQITDAGFCPGLLNKVDFAGRYVCYMIAPQVPTGKWWSAINRTGKAPDAPKEPGDQMRMALELVDAALVQYPIDPNRVYVTGLSMGGFGTWDAVQRRPEFFAAAVPVCGGGDAAQADKLTKIPLWVWHGDSDPVVPPRCSRDMVAAIRKAGGKPIYNEQPNCGHSVWTFVYGNVKVWDWMFAQVRGKPAAAPATKETKETAAAKPATGKQGASMKFKGTDGPGKGKQVVLISGDEEYRSEEAVPQLGKILALRHGFDCTVLFAIDPATGEINPSHVGNIPGLEALASADLMVIATRFRDLPDEQMRHVVDYVAAGKPIIGMRTATHAFRIPEGKTYSRWTFNSKDWPGGFGRQILGETWVDHHGQHGKQSTRGLVAPGAAGYPIVRGCDDIWSPTDVYTVNLPLSGDGEALVLGAVLEGMSPADKPVAGPKNVPMMPIAWTRTYQLDGGRAGRAFTTTMGAATDLLSEGVRRLLVNAAYWCTGLGDKIPARADVDLVGAYNPTWFGFNGFVKGLRPVDFAKE